jgi:hypothetical protein
MMHFTDPITHGTFCELDTAALMNAALPIDRLVIQVFANHHMG